MDLNELVEQVLGAAVVPVSAPAEAGYHALWLEHELGSRDPVMMAALGGALADRLAWVFVAGYQSTISHCFPGLPPERGWSAFVNTEDRSGSLPGTSLTGASGSRRLSGTKTWVAAADHVDLLLVSARPNEVPFVVIRRDQPGVRIEVDAPKSYLSEMAQGRVTFENVVVGEEQLIGDERTFPVFRTAEPAYVRIALNAFILSHACRLGAPPALVGGAISGLLSAGAIPRLPMPSKAATLGLLGTDGATRSLSVAFDAFVRTHDAALYQLWSKDSRLVHGASASIAARAAIALGLPRS